MVFFFCVRYTYIVSDTKWHQADCCAFIIESLKVYRYTCVDLWLTYVTCGYYFEVLYDTIHPWHHTWKISNTYNTYFQCYCGSNISSEMANLEHWLTWKVASLFPQNAHVKSGTKWLPKNALKSWISQKLKMVEQKCKSHNTPHHQSYPKSLVSSL